MRIKSSIAFLFILSSLSSASRAESCSEITNLSEKKACLSRFFARSFAAGSEGVPSKSLYPYNPAYAEKFDYKLNSDSSLNRSDPFRNRFDGCEYPKRMVYHNKRVGFLWLKTKKIPIGCMTQAEFNRWNIEQENARKRSMPSYSDPTPVIIQQPTQPTQPTYQPRPRSYPQPARPTTCIGGRSGLYGTSMYTCY